MAKKSVGNTALGAAICRLIEQYQPDETRLFNDPVVKDLVSAPIRLVTHSALVRKFTVQRTDAVAAGIYGAQVCRTRFIDDAVQSALSEGIRQAVILGAGFDTRPYRLPGMERVTVFEVDLPSVQNIKKNGIRKHFGRLPKNVVFASIDFETQSLENVLTGASFDLSIPALFIWEGGTQYVSEEAVGRTLSFIGKSSPGSMIVFTYVLKSIIERRSGIPEADNLMDFVARQSPWIFGLEPSGIEAYLQLFNLTLQADVGDEFYQEKYLQPISRNLTVFKGERIVQAIVA